MYNCQMLLLHFGLGSNLGSILTRNAPRNKKKKIYPPILTGFGIPLDKKETFCGRKTAH